MRSPNPSDVIQKLLKAHRIAIVGLSDDPYKPSHQIALYLRSRGREIVPVNPLLTEVLGERAYRSLMDVPGKIDLVNVFRRPEHCPEIVRVAIEKEAGGVWLQSGIHSDPCVMLARTAGLPFVQDRCIMVEMSMAGE